jgi:hypothetical protein
MNDSPPSLVSTQQTASNLSVLVHRLMVGMANASGHPSTFASIWEEQVLCCRYPSLRAIAFSGQLVGVRRAVHVLVGWLAFAQHLAMYVIGTEPGCVQAPDGME